MNHISNIETLMAPHIADDEVYSSHSVRCLTAPGDNYGSLMLAAEIRTRKKNGNNDERERNALYVVAKKVPPVVAMQEVFQSQVTFRKELAMYRTIVPTLREFLAERGMANSMDFFPRFYGGLLENAGLQNGVSNGGERPNETVILLENLKVSGYDTQDRIEGFDLETIELVLEDLAVFHAVPIALKLEDPKCFQQKVFPHLDKFYCYDHMDEALKMGDLESIVEVLEDSGKFDQDVIDRVRSAYVKGSTSGAISVSEPFATITHNDLWINNVMIKSASSKSTRNKIIDFQVIDYGSPGKDLVFLIFSSVQQSVIEEHFMHLIEVYYNKFVETLEKLKCETKTFSLEGLLKELEDSARTSQIFHLLIMLQVVFSDESNVKALENNEKVVPTPRQIERTCFIVEDFVSRGWL